MSALIVDDIGSSAIVDTETEVNKLQDLVRKLQVQNQILLGQSDKQSIGTDVENSPYVVDANCNTDLFQCTTPPRTGVLREQQLNSSNARLNAKTAAPTDDSVDNVREDVPQLDHSSASDSDALLMNTKVHTGNLSLDSVQLVDVDGNLSDDEESWSASDYICRFSDSLVLSK